MIHIHTQIDTPSIMNRLRTTEKSFELGELTLLKI